MDSSIAAIPAFRAAVTSTVVPGSGAAAQRSPPSGEQTVCTFSLCRLCFSE